MKAAFYTLGCKVNQSETAALQAQFAAAGWQIVDPAQPADVFVVNSCTVTAAGEGKSRRWLHRARREPPGAVIVLTGCLPQAFPQKALDLPDADVVTGTACRAGLLADIERFMQTGRRVVNIPGHTPGKAFEELAHMLPAPAAPGENAPAREHTRAFLKIQDGCDGRCAYCIVPTARGALRSRAIDSIVSEAHALAAGGVAEVVLTGINLPSYGRDTGADLADVVEALEAVDGIRRVRLSSLDPHRVTPAQVARLAACGKLCPHFHLSLQSGCDATLARMRRPYTAAQYRAAALALRAAMPAASLTTDVIVGFPGESADEFAQSLTFVTEMDFLKVHVFPFSARAGTAAAGFDGQLPKDVKTARAAKLQRAADARRAVVIAGRLGQHRTALLEAPTPDGLFTGYTECYIPILVPAPAAHQGDVVQVKLEAYDEKRDAVLCSIVKPKM